MKKNTQITPAMSKKKNIKTEKSNDNNIKLPDPVEFSKALLKAYERAQPIISECIERQSEYLTPEQLDPMNVREAYAKMMERWMEDPHSFWETQAEYWQKWMYLWQESTLKLIG